MTAKNVPDYCLEVILKALHTADIEFALTSIAAEQEGHL
jgi:hypothetical protein